VTKHRLVFESLLNIEVASNAMIERTGKTGPELSLTMARPECKEFGGIAVMPLGEDLLP
jgi:hypothetical protein